MNPSHCRPPLLYDPKETILLAYSTSSLALINILTFRSAYIVGKSSAGCRHSIKKGVIPSFTSCV